MVEVTVGVLAVQGSFAEHVIALNRLNQKVYGKNSGGGGSAIIHNKEDEQMGVRLGVIEIRSSKDIDDEMQGLIIPGKCKMFGSTVLLH